jgi:hypothetical protein
MHRYFSCLLVFLAMPIMIHKPDTQLSCIVKNADKKKGIYEQDASPIPTSLPGNIGSSRGSRSLRVAATNENHLKPR